MLFQELGVEKRLSILMKGESLFNDGMAVVAFRFLASFALGVEQFKIQLILVQLFAVMFLARAWLSFPIPFRLSLVLKVHVGFNLLVRQLLYHLAPQHLL